MQRDKIYKKLSNAWEYKCPSTDANYVGINGGVNCLCRNWNEGSVNKKGQTNEESKHKHWPIGNPDLGWKCK